MPLMNTRELRQMYEGLGPRETCARITESLQRSRAGEIGHLKPSDFSIRQIAEGMVENGADWVRSLDPSNYGTAVMESADAVDSTAFANITGQLLINELMDAYMSPVFAISQMFRTVSTRLRGEKIPGLAKIGDQTEDVREGMPFPRAGFGEDYIETPETIKRGLIVDVTREAVFFDRTGMMLENARQVGESIGINKEKRCVDVLIGAVNNHNWRGTAYDTYQATTPWINLLAGSTHDLVDWTDVESAELLFADIEDPNTLEPVGIMPNTLIATPARKHTLNRIINATEVRYTGSSAPSETLATNPLSGAGYRGTTSQYVYSRLQSELSISAANSKATWFLGEMDKAFRYMENWPITVIQAPANNDVEFERDVVARFRASEMGVPVSWNPRYMVKVTGY